MRDRNGPGPTVFVAGSTVALVEDGAKAFFFKDWKSEQDLAFLESLELDRIQSVEGLAEPLLELEPVVGEDQGGRGGGHENCGRTEGQKSPPGAATLVPDLHVHSEASSGNSRLPRVLIIFQQGCANCTRRQPTN